jgi:hypothetical protein
MINYPDSPTIGQIFTSGGESWKWDGTKWATISTTVPQYVATCQIGATPPTTPLVGDLWWDNVGGQLYLWYDDGTSKQWVVANNPMLASYLALAGGTMTGAITLAADPIAPLQATTKRYTDKMLPLAGGTMTGDLTINSPDEGGLNLNAAHNWAGISMNAPVGYGSYISANVNGKERWEIDLGDISGESGNNKGSNLSIIRYDDFGAYIDAPLQINRATGMATLSHQLCMGFTPPATAVAATIGFPATGIITATPPSGGGGNVNLAYNAYFDGTTWRYSTGNDGVTLASFNQAGVNFYSMGAGTANAPFNWNQTFAVDVNGNTSITGNTEIHGNATIDGNVTTNNITYGWLISNNFYGHAFTFGWDGTGTRVAVDGGDQGYLINGRPWGGWYSPYMQMWNPNGWCYCWSTSGAIRWTYTWDSDRRLKKNIVPATIDALGAINQLKVYELDYTPPLIDAPTRHMECAIIADEIEHLIPSAYSGPIDIPDGTPSYAAINILPLTCTLIRAFQQLTDKVTSLNTRNDELLERIIALEARHGRA